MGKYTERMSISPGNRRDIHSAAVWWSRWKQLRMVMQPMKKKMGQIMYSLHKVSFPIIT